MRDLAPAGHRRAGTPGQKLPIRPTHPLLEDTQFGEHGATRLPTLRTKSGLDVAECSYHCGSLQR